MKGGTTASWARGPAIAIVVALGVLVATAGVAVAAGSTTISIVPGTESVDVGETTTFRVVVDDADGGVGAAEIGIVVDDPDVAGITNVTVLGTGEEDVEIAEDGSSAEVDFAFRDTADTGPVPIVEVTLEGRAEGETGLSIGATEGNEAVLVFDEGATGYEVTDTEGSTLAVGEGDSTPGGDGGDGDGGGGSDGDTSGEVRIVGGRLLNETVTTDTDVVARVDLTNDDPVRGTVTLRLTTNGSTVAERTVAVGASTDRTVLVRHRVERSGTYDVSVNGVSLGSVRVTTGAIPTPTATVAPSRAASPTTTTPTATTDDAVTSIATERSGTTEDREGRGTARDGPGFGLLAAALSVLVSGLLLRRTVY